MIDSSIHLEVTKAQDAVKFPVKALDPAIQAKLILYKEQYHLVMINNYVLIKYNQYGFLFIYIKDDHNVPIRIDIEL